MHNTLPFVFKGGEKIVAIPIGIGNFFNVEDPLADSLYLRVDLYNNRFMVVRGGANGTSPSGQYPTFPLIPNDEYRVIINVGTSSGAVFELYNLSVDPSASNDLLAAVNKNTVTGGSFVNGYVFSNIKSSSVISKLYSVSVEHSATYADAPTLLQATPKSTEVDLSWDAPVSNGGVAITDYLVEYKLNSDSDWSEFSDGVSTNTNASVTGLINDQLYDFRVSTINALGPGSPSSIVSATPVLEEPSIPLNIIASNTVDNQIDLSWDTPLSSGASPITDYLVEYKLNSDSDWSEFSDGVSTNTNTNITGLINGKTYDIRIYAINNNGTSDPSSVITQKAISMTALAPEASELLISGSPYKTEIIKGSYVYNDPNGDNEGVSVYRWLSSDSINGTYTPISGSTSNEYVLSQSDLNKYIKFEVTPVSNVNPLMGISVTSLAFGPISEASYIYHILSTGQSLSLGYNGVPVLSTTQPYNNKMLDGSNNLSPLIESSYESPASAMGNGLTSLNGYQIAVTKHGVGNTEYAGLKKGTNPYLNGLNQALFVKSGAENIGKVSRIIAVTSIHGERDHVIGTDASTYEGYLSEWQEDYDNDLKMITGQYNDIPLFTDQVSSFTGYNSATSVIPIAQLNASENNLNKIYLVTPKYFFDYADFAHITNTSYGWLGEYYAKVINKVVHEGVSWRPLSPDRAIISGNIIYVDFHVPEGELVFDTTLVSERNNKGFEYYDSTSSATISNVEILDEDTVKITLSGIPTGNNQRVRYAYTGVPGTQPGAQNSDSAGGNLRDTDTATSLYGNTLYNWAVHFDEPIIVDSSLPTNSLISSVPSSNSSIITWATDEASSSIVDYGLTDSYGTSTVETNTSPRVTTHSVILSNLISCMTYHYRVKSKDQAQNQGISSGGTFTTTGCTGDAEILDEAQDEIETGTGGTLNLLSGSYGLGLSVPAGATNTDASFQIKKLDYIDVIIATDTPEQKSLIGDYTYEIKSLSDVDEANTSFNEAITITLSYNDADVIDVDESTLLIYRYDGTTWSALSNCSVDTNLNTVTCSTLNFSLFGLFGLPRVEASSHTSGSGIHYGCKDPKALNYEYFSSHNPNLCKYEIEQKTNTSTLNFTRTLKYNMKGDDVKALQVYLNNHGYPVAITGPGSLGNETTYFGNLTKKAIIKFQLANKLIGDGIVGPMTRGVIK